MERMLETFQSFKKTYVEDNVSDAVKGVDSLISIAKSVTDEQLTWAKERSNQILTTAKAHTDTTLVEYQSAEDRLLKEIKVGIAYCNAHPYEAAAVASGLAVVLLPGGRRLLWNNTLGLFQSEEALLLKTKSKLESLQSRVISHASEAAAAESAAQSAAQAFKEAQLNLRNAEGLLEELTTRGRRMEIQSTDLQNRLRKLPGKEALKLRTEVAMIKSSASQQTSSVNRAWRMASKTLGN